MKKNLFNFFKKRNKYKAIGSREKNDDCGVHNNDQDASLERGESVKKRKKQKVYHFFCPYCDYSWQAEEPYSYCPQCAAKRAATDI